MPPKEVRDAIHGLINIEPSEWSVIDSAPFQRLRGVQQLAMTHLVYPGARHSRFEHCLGVAEVAGRIARSAELDEATMGRVRMAALTHDLGHGPFSHVSEEIFEKKTGRQHVHEGVSAAIVRNHPQVRGAMGDEAAEWVADILSGTGAGERRSVERDIVAGPADADKLDYLLRDSQYCGVKYGEYDLEKVVESACVVMERYGGATYLGFDVDCVFALEEMLLARYHMHRQVYGHRTRVATDRMLVRAIESGIDEGVLPADVFGPPEGADLAFVDEYLQWDDARVVAVLSGTDSPAGELMRALIDRRLFKELVTYDFERLIREFGRPNAGDVATPSKRVLQDHLEEAEKIVAEAIGTDPHWVCIHWADIENPLGSEFSWKIQGKEILVVDDDGEARQFNETSEVFTDTEREGRIRVSLFARLPDGRSKRDLAPDELARIEDATQRALAVVAEAEATK